MIHEAKGPPGAHKLLAYIRREFETVPEFCAAKGLDRLKVQNAIRGIPSQLGVALAMDLEEATDGEVKVVDWRCDKSRQGSAA